MEYNQREFFLYRIINAYIEYTNKARLKIYSPSIDIKYKAQKVYRNTYNLGIINGLFTDEELLNFLLVNELWTEKEENLLTNVLPENIDNLKVNVYKSNMDVNAREQYRKELRKTEQQTNELYNKRHSYDFLSSHYLATYHKLLYIIQRTTKNSDGNLYNWKKIPLEHIATHYQKNTLSDKIIRELARTEPWQSIWSSSECTGTLFNKSSIELSDEQLRLIQWSLLYDNIKECADPPHITIIADDDMFDGWMILRRRESEKEQGKKTVKDGLTNKKIANSQEVFVIAKNKEHAKAIENMNDNIGKSIKKQREHAINKQGAVEQHNLPDVRQEVNMEYNKMVSAKIKGK